jgi:hypothetical protein
LRKGVGMSVSCQHATSNVQIAQRKSRPKAALTQT